MPRNSLGARIKGIAPVAVYSDADAKARPMYRWRTKRSLIGPGASANESYLFVDNILMAAKSSGAEAIHPGYGFSKRKRNVALRRVTMRLAGLYRAQRSDAIRLMGNKAEAKRRMIAAEVPCVPGYEGQDQDDETLLRGRCKHRATVNGQGFRRRWRPRYAPGRQS